MANQLGAATPIVVSLPNQANARKGREAAPTDDVSTVRAKARPEPATARLPRVEPQEATALAERVVALVSENVEGLTAVEIRDMLSVQPDALQRALTIALRGAKLRRLGARCKTRYLANR